jgi:hypothetical protein
MRHAISHLVPGRDRIAERWRNPRRDYPVAIGAAWHDRFPRHDLFLGMTCSSEPEGFPGKEKVPTTWKPRPAATGRRSAPALSVIIMALVLTVLLAFVARLRRREV